MGVEHELKLWPEFWDDLSSGKKTFEYRKDDREFATGDRLRLVEWDPATSTYTGREMEARVTYVLRGGRFGVPASYVVMSVRVTAKTFGVKR